MTIRVETIAFDIDSLLQRFAPKTALESYFEYLMRENERINLVSRETSQEDLNRLAAESLLPLSIVERNFTQYLDIGSGGGFPAIPLLLSGRIKGDTWLVERTQKKAAALRRILDRLNLNAGVLAKTSEELTFTTGFDLITLRYVKLTSFLLKKILTWLEPAGRFLYYSTPEFDCSSFTAVCYSFATEFGDVTKSFTIFEP